MCVVNENGLLVDWRLYWRPVEVTLRKNGFNALLCLFFQYGFLKKSKNVNTGLTGASESRSNTYDAPCRYVNQWFTKNFRKSKYVLWCSYYASMLAEKKFNNFPACSLLLEPACLTIYL